LVPAPVRERRLLGRPGSGRARADGGKRLRPVPGRVLRRGPGLHAHRDRLAIPAQPVLDADRQAVPPPPDSLRLRGRPSPDPQSDRIPLGRHQGHVSREGGPVAGQPRPLQARVQLQGAAIELPLLAVDREVLQPPAARPRRPLLDARRRTPGVVGTEAKLPSSGLFSPRQSLVADAARRAGRPGHHHQLRGGSGGRVRGYGSVPEGSRPARREGDAAQRLFPDAGQGSRVQPRRFVPVRRHEPGPRAKGAPRRRDRELRPGPRPALRVLSQPALCRGEPPEATPVRRRFLRFVGHLLAIRTQSGARRWHFGGLEGETETGVDGV